MAAADPRSNLEIAIQTGIDAALKELHTSLPGEVISFDPVEQTADIQITIKRKQANELVNIPVLKDVPVRFQRVSGYTITLPVKSGDNVLVVFSERSIDTWLLNGGIQDPADKRRHSFSDAFALPMMYSQPDKISDFDPDNLQIKSLNGNSKITIKLTGEIQIDTTGETIINSSKTKINNNTEIDGTLLVTGKITGEDGEAITGAITATANITATGNVVGAELKVPGKPDYSTHSHTQTADSDGDTQQNVSAPT